MTPKVLMLTAVASTDATSCLVHVGIAESAVEVAAEKGVRRLKYVQCAGK